MISDQIWSYILHIFALLFLQHTSEASHDRLARDLANSARAYRRAESAGDYRRKVQLARLCALCVFITVFVLFVFITVSHASCAPHEQKAESTHRSGYD